MITLPHCDLNITTICNYRCAACSHGSPFSNPYWMTVETAIRDLASVKDVLHFNQLCIVGGEPTLHTQLMDFIRAARNSGVGDQIVVVTNGSKLHDMKDDFWREIDVLRYSMYGRRESGTLLLAAEKCTQHDVDLQAWAYPEFFKQLKATPDDGVESFKNCPWKSDCYTIHEGHFFLCPQSAFFPARIMGLNVNEGLPLEGITEESVNAYLNRSEPFTACKVCCAGEKKLFPWMESTKTSWIADSTEST